MILFRVDGNSIIGIGHVMRCLSIAEEYKKNGQKCIFITAGDESKHIIESHGFADITLNTKFDNMESELETLISEIGELKITQLIVDSYYATEKYMSELWQYCSKYSITLIYIDDLINKPKRCDVLINYNIYANEKEYQSLYGGYGCPKLLLNTEYVPMREEFQNIPNRINNNLVKNILISTGGSDSQEIGLQLLKTIISCNKLRMYNFHFVVGAMNVNYDIMKNLSQNINNIYIHIDVKKMVELMQKCDIAISAAGSTLYELCATQTPTITYVLADNQVQGAQEFEHRGILKCAGNNFQKNTEILINNIIELTIELCENYKEREEISEKMGTVVDGNGTKRIIKLLNS